MLGVFTTLLMNCTKAFIDGFFIEINDLCHPVILPVIGTKHTATSFGYVLI